MYMYLLLAALFAFGILCGSADSIIAKMRKPGQEMTNWQRSISYCSLVEGGFMWILLISGFAIFVCICITISGAIGVGKDYETRAVTYDLIEARIESGVCGYDKCVLDEIAEYNSSHRSNTYYHTNRWTNWFVFDSCRDLPLIDFPAPDAIDHSQHVYRFQGGLSEE